MEGIDLNNKRKRMMFIVSEDYNLLVYKILCILEFYKCFNTSKQFNDIRKISSLIQFMENEGSVQLFQDAYEGEINIYDRDKLYKINLKANLVKVDVIKIIHALELKEIIEVSRKDTIIKINLIKNESVLKLISNEFFNSEKGNIKKLQKTMSKLKTVGYDRYYYNLFRKNGVV